jgi:hypothetical protein
MSKLLIAVGSSIKNLDFGLHDVVRETWKQTVGSPVRFFFGPSSAPRELYRYQPDETVIDCPDNNESSPTKTRAICQWAIGKQIDNIFFVDTSVYVKADALRHSGYEQHDYVPTGPKDFGYILSRKAFTILAAIPPIGDLNSWLNQTLGPRLDSGELTFAPIWGLSERYQGEDENINPTGLMTWMRETHVRETKQ